MIDNMSKKKPLVILTGPTASGKTSLSIKLAKLINAEIISADSMQVYKGLDIGSAKITKDEMEGVRHHLIDVYDFDFDYNVALFKEEANKCINEIYKRGKIPLIVGGTGFYIQAVLKDVDFTQTIADDKFRLSLYTMAKDKGPTSVHDILKKLDPDAANSIHPNNVKRVVRAIEFAKETGSLISQHNETEKEKPSPYNFAYYVITRERELLYERINKRVEIMIDQGLYDEVKELYDKGATSDMVSMQGLGYKEMLSYINGEILDFDEVKRLIKRNTRHFAKRQMTWFRREKDVIYLDADTKSEEKLIDEISSDLRSKNILQ